jgi:hypothetical protein
MSKIRLYGETSGYLELKAPAVSPDAAVEIPVSFGPHGKVLQAVSTSKTDTFSASINDGGISPVTGMSVSITPSAATSKVLVLVSVNAAVSELDHVAYVTLKENASSVFVGDGFSYRQRVSGMGTIANTSSSLIAFTYLASPATTSPVSYSIDISHSRGAAMTVYVNRRQYDLDNKVIGRAASSITAIEIGA